jgi:diguanylate cyclase (GGDEF)-like protein
MTWDEWIYLAARTGLAILMLGASWITARYAQATVRASDRGYWGFAVTGLLVAAALLCLYDGVDNVLINPDLPVLASSWLWFFIFDVPMPILALLLVRSQWRRDELMRRFQQQSVTDALTELLNRRGFLDQGARAIAQARRAGTHAAVAMLDLDHFKKVNDTFGHAAGDTLLHKVAGAARLEVRSADLFGRLGGDEFGLLIVGPGMAAAIEAAGRVRDAIDAALDPLQGGSDVGVSCGIAPVGVLGEALAALGQALSAADAALYEAKRSGRAGMVVSDLPSTGSTKSRAASSA